MKGGCGSYNFWLGGAPDDVDVWSVVGRRGEGDHDCVGYSRVGGSSGGARRRLHVLLSSSVMILQSLFHCFHCLWRTWHLAAVMNVHFGEWSSCRWMLVCASRVLK